MWEKFGLFTKSIKANITKVLLPEVEKLNKKVAGWIDSGKMAEQAREWASSSLYAIAAILQGVGFAKAMSEYHKIPIV